MTDLVTALFRILFRKVEDVLEGVAARFAFREEVVLGLRSVGQPCELELKGRLRT